MTLRFTGGEHLQRGRGLGGLLRLAKSVFSPIARTVVPAKHVKMHLKIKHQK